MNDRSFDPSRADLEDEFIFEVGRSRPASRWIGDLDFEQPFAFEEERESEIIAPQESSDVRARP
jgi:hypothetical protein